MYLLYLILHPMNIKFTWALFLFAALLSTLERNNILSDAKLPHTAIEQGVVNTLLEEECMNTFFMIFLVPSGKLLKLIIHIFLYLWAIMHVSDMALEQLERDPETPVIASFHRYFTAISYSKTEINQVRSYIEVLIGVLSVPLVLLMQSALIFPIIYFQYIRIKYVSSLYLRKSFRDFNKCIVKRVLPE